MSVAEIEDKIPVVRARGTNYEIGFAHGFQAKKQVNITLDNLKKSVEDTVGLGWDACVKIAGAFMPVVKKKVPEYLEEVRGIAEGSGNSFEDIFTLNCRTELGHQFACEFGTNMEKVRELTGDCSVIGITQERTAGGTNLYCQNWDSSPSQIPTLIYVIAHQTNRPSIAWTGEAGLLCRMGGMNDCGIGVGGNTLSTNAPIDFDGLPLQFAYRRIMDQKTFADAVEAAADSHVASNINLLVAGPEGEMVNIEVEYRGYKILNKKNGVISHANIYKHPKLPSAPYIEKEYPKGVLRSFRLDSLAEGLKGNELGVEDIKRIMTDHKNYPAGSICRHGEAIVTVFSAINDLNHLEMYLSVGNPCKGYCCVKPFEEEF